MITCRAHVDSGNGCFVHGVHFVNCIVARGLEGRLWLPS
jgi:hypothetical protein